MSKLTDKLRSKGRNQGTSRDTNPELTQAGIVANASARSVTDFVELGPTPGNVGVAFCGGGSRAKASGLGQLRGLANVLPAGGGDHKQPLLGLTKAISAVSGGAWLTAPFMYLPDEISDHEYLGVYVPDPGRLVPRKSFVRDESEELSQMAEGYAGQSIGHPRFTVPGLAIQLLLLKRFGKVPTERLWQTIVGLNILKPFGLYEKGDDFAPTSSYSYDRQTHERDVTTRNPHLADYKFHLVADGEHRIRRPFWICNTSMFVNEPHAGGQDLVPVQSTPFFTGILADPSGVDANGRPVGGGAVTSFAFNSDPEARHADTVHVKQPRPFSLTDIVGLSSVAFASALEQQVDEWRRDHKPLAEVLLERADEIAEWFQEHFDSKFFDAADALLHRTKLQTFLEKAGVGKKIDAELHKAMEEIESLIPEAVYWSVAEAQAKAAHARYEDDTAATKFADGGNLENTGVAALLTYHDIDRIVAFVNSPASMKTVDIGVLSPKTADGGGDEIPDTRIHIDGQIPVLFGYQFHREGLGYQLFRDAEPDSVPQDQRAFRTAQVFPSEDFPAVVRGLWAASHGLQRPAIFEQTLKTVDNPTFGVVGGREVRVLWFYLDKVQDWIDLLSDDVRALLRRRSFQSFPNFPTNQGLDATHLNLLAHLTSWCVADASNRGIFQRFFEA